MLCRSLSDRNRGYFQNGTAEHRFWPDETIEKLWPEGLESCNLLHNHQIADKTLHSQLACNSIFA